jgi:hypothetical protein
VQASPRGNQALIVAAVVVLVVAAGVGSWFLFFNKPATDASKPSTTQTSTSNAADEADAAGIVAKLNDAIDAGDATAWDTLWDGTAVGEYLQPILVNAAENGAAWSQIVAQVGTEAEARSRLESVLTVSMLDSELRKALFTGKSLFGEVTNTTVSGTTAVVTTVDSNNDEIALRLEKRATGWAVVGFDSEAFITGFVTSFESTVLNP